MRQQKEKWTIFSGNMITVSDNESCNELGRLQSEKHDFLDGAEKVNEYLKKEGYENTSYQSTLAPALSPKLNLGSATTTVRTVESFWKIFRENVSQ